VSLGTRLGNADTRRRRHVRFAILAAALLAIGMVLVFFVDDDDDGGSTDFATAATAECEAFSERLAAEYELSFPEGPPNQGAVAEYISHAFADTMDDLVAALRALEGSDVATAVLDDLDTRIQEVRADPAPYAAGEAFMFDGVAEQFDELGLTACGSDFQPS
jgi:hypothetical protein